MDSSLTPIQERLAFVQEAGRLKDILRTAYTASGRQESTAEHTWCLCLFLISFADLLPHVDLLKVLKIAILHDLGEAIHGDIPAIAQAGMQKSVLERQDLLLLMQSLPTVLRDELLALWDEYDQVTSTEAQVVKAFDKLETLMQHTQGENPAEFDYVFNLGYGQQYTQQHPLFAAIRAELDAATRQRAKVQVSAMKIESLMADTELELLLDLCRLPNEDVTDTHLQFFGIRRANKLIAAIGLESYNQIGLLRSFAVLPDYRGLGVGARLVHFLEKTAVQQEIKDLYLLTTTASTYFQSLGYQVIERQQAPSAIQKTTQFKDLCPASASLLCKTIMPMPSH